MVNLALGALNLLCCRWPWTEHPSTMAACGLCLIRTVNLNYVNIVAFVPRFTFACVMALRSVVVVVVVFIQSCGHKTK